ncbi:MAG: hypothetical protein ACOC04_03045 [Halothece sp.]
MEFGNAHHHSDEQGQAQGIAPTANFNNVGFHADEQGQAQGIAPTNS